MRTHRKGCVQARKNLAASVKQVFRSAVREGTEPGSTRESVSNN